jgi:hypothetical protein
MLHLFNKTYLDIDAFIDMNENRVVLSELYGTPVWSVVEGTTAGELLAYGASPDALFEDEEQSVNSYADLFDMCYEKTQTDGRKVIIYADKDSYNSIASALFKTIFINIDVDSAYKIIQSTFARDIVLGGRETFLLEAQVVNAKPTAEEFATQFNAVSVDGSSAEVVALFEKIKSSLSLEYNLASYFAQPETYKDKLRPIMKNMINRFVEEATKEAYRAYCAAILNPTIRTRLGITNNYTISNIEDVLNEPALAALKKTNTWRSAGGVGLPRETLDLSTFTAEEITTIKEQCYVVKQFLNADFDVATVELIYSRIQKYIDLLADGVITDQDMIDIVDFDLGGPDDDRFWSFKDRAQINEYLIEEFLAMKGSDNLAGLTPYLLKT